MNLELSWGVKAFTLNFISNILFNNVYDINVYVLTNTSSLREQSITFERQKTFLSTVLDDSIFLDYTKQDHKVLIKELAQNFVYLPDTPSDHTVCSALYYKLCAIAENKLVVECVELSSTRGEGICYSISNTKSVSEFIKNPPWLIGTKVKPWWHRNDPTTRDDFLLNGDLIEGDLTWDELGLSYPEPKETPGLTVIKGGKSEE